MNELLFFGLTIFSFAMVLLGLRMGRDGLIAIAIIFAVLANLFFAKVTTIFGMVTSPAVPLYIAIFFASKMLTEHFDAKDAYKATLFGYIGQITIVISGYFIIKTSVIPDNAPVAGAFATIFTFLPRLTLGSMLSYPTGSFLNIFLFKLFKKITGGRFVGIRSFLSTAIAQFADTTVFVFVGFFGKIDNILLFTVTYWAMKVLVVALDTPFTYLSYKIANRKA